MTMTNIKKCSRIYTGVKKKLLGYLRKLNEILKRERKLDQVFLPDLY